MVFDENARRRFMAKIRQNSAGCWIWTGATQKGYGCFSLGGKPRRAHRLSWEMANGASCGDLFVCHRCDVRLCVNPDHLFLGTNRDNLLDAKAKKRTTIGERNRHAKLAARDVAAIRSRRAAGETGVALAAFYGVSAATICDITKRRSWEHVS